MSEVREVLERTFSSEGNAHAITLAALWLSTHDDVEVDSIVGDNEFVYVYYTEDKPPVASRFGVVQPTSAFDGLFDGRQFTLKGRAG